MQKTPNDTTLRPISYLERKDLDSTLESFTQIRKALARKNTVANIGHQSSQLVTKLSQEVLELQAQIVRSAILEDKGSPEEKSDKLWQLSMLVFSDVTPGWNYSAEQNAVKELHKVLAGVKKPDHVAQTLHKLTAVLKGAELPAAKGKQAPQEAVENFAKTLQLKITVSNDDPAYIFGQRLKNDNKAYEKQEVKHLAVTRMQTAFSK